jgi:uncharacterized protein (TIGR02265 family)
VPRAPRFEAPVDLEAHVALVKPGATLRGFFVTDAITRARAAEPRVNLHAIAKVAPRRYLPFLSYDYREYLRLLHAAAGVISPSIPRGEALRRLAWSTYDTFIGTPVGKIIFDMMGRDVAGVLSQASRGYSVSVNFGEVTSQTMGTRYVLVRYRNMPSFLETTQVGVIEGAVKHCGAEPDVQIELMDLANADLHVRW